MQSNRSDSEKKFPARYHSDKCTAAQYLVELVCERMALKDKLILSPGFWSVPTWKKTYRYQLISANRLLKMYRIEAIIAALREKKTIYSLSCKWLEPVIQDYQLKLERKEEKLETSVIEQTPVVEQNATPRTSFTNKSSAKDKLRGLDE